MSKRGYITNQVVTCHPDRKYYSKGLCLLCYRASMSKKHSKIYQERKKEAVKPSVEYVYSKQPIVDIPDLLRDDYWINQSDARHLPKLITV